MGKTAVRVPFVVREFLWKIHEKLGVGPEVLGAYEIVGPLPSELPEGDSVPEALGRVKIIEDGGRLPLIVRATWFGCMWNDRASYRYEAVKGRRVFIRQNETCSPAVEDAQKWVTEMDAKYRGFVATIEERAATATEPEIVIVRFVLPTL